MEANYSTPEVDDQDETEETLSFCDLPMYSSDAADWEKAFKEDQSLLLSSSTSSSSSSDQSSDQGFFEFFSEDWSNSRISYPRQNILFCGKVIPFEEPVHIKTTDNLENQNLEKPKTRFLFRWKSNWFSKQNDPKNQPKAKFSRSKSEPEKLRRKVAKGDKKYGFSLRKLSIRDSPARLWVFGFGVRVPAEMELRDIKSRQSKRNPPAALFTGGDGGDEKVGGGIGLWAMVRALGCGGGSRWSAVEESPFRSVPIARVD